MDFKSPRVHLRCELLGPCAKDGACIGRGSELNSWGQRVQAELTMDFKLPRIHLLCKLLGPCAMDGACSLVERMVLVQGDGPN